MNKPGIINKKKERKVAGSKSNRVRIKLKSFDYRLLDSFTAKIIKIVSDTGAEVTGKIPLPTKIRRYCVNSSTHVDKRSGEHFEIRVHFRMFEIKNPNEEVMGILQRMDLPSGVGVSIQVVVKK